LKYKRSQFNNIIKYDENIIYYNSLYNSIFSVDNETHQKIAFVLNNPIIEDSSIKTLLVKTKFLLEDNVDELLVSELLHNEGKYTFDTLCITIILSYNCNFNCFYCFQRETRKNERNVVFSKSSFDKLTEFITERVTRYRFKKLDITWMGGEPLLFKEELKFYYSALKVLAKRLDIELYNLIISNGYLFDKDFFEFISKAENMRVQITIDGPPDSHNKKREHKKSENTFCRILSNVETLIKMEVDTFIRINIAHNEENYMSNIDELFGCFEQTSVAQKKGIVHIAKIEPIINNISEYSEKEFKAFSDIEFEIYKKYLTKDYLYIPKLKLTSGCRALGTYEYIVDPSGKIFKCPMHTQQEYCVGSINNFDLLDQNYLKWLAWTPFNKEKCKRCSILPICMGGCPFFDIYKSQGNICSNIKLYYQNRVIIEYLRKTAYINNV